MNVSIDSLHIRARRAIEAGENKFRDAAECLAEAQQLGATQRQSAQAVGKSPAWVNALLKWRKSGYKDHCPSLGPSALFSRLNKKQSRCRRRAPSKLKRRPPERKPSAPVQQKIVA
jgi:hypothetical protein